jgi:hypothetical protein
VAVEFGISPVCGIIAGLFRGDRHADVRIQLREVRRVLVSGGSTFILSGKNWISKLPTPKDDMAKIKERILKRTVLDEAEETPKIPPHRYHGRRSTN